MKTYIERGAFAERAGLLSGLSWGRVPFSVRIRKTKEAGSFPIKIARLKARPGQGHGRAARTGAQGGREVSRAFIGRDEGP